MKIKQLEACILPLPVDAMGFPEKQVLQARPAGRSPLLGSRAGSRSHNARPSVAQLAIM